MYDCIIILYFEGYVSWQCWQKSWTSPLSWKKTKNKTQTDSYMSTRNLSDCTIWDPAGVFCLFVLRGVLMPTLSICLSRFKYNIYLNKAFVQFQVGTRIFTKEYKLRMTNFHKFLPSRSPTGSVWVFSSKWPKRNSEGERRLHQIIQGGKRNKRASLLCDDVTVSPSQSGDPGETHSTFYPP